MDISRESSLLSQGTLEQLMNIVNPGEIEMMLKTENFYEEPFHGNIFESAIIPISTSALSSVVDYSGPCELNVELGRSSDEKTKWEEPFHGDIFEIPFDVNQPDSTQRFNESIIFPISTSALPSVVDYSGPCEFDVEIGRSSDEKTKWEYSISLKKLFVIMEGKIPLQFKWNQSEHGLHVRVLPVFLKQDSFSQPVVRCPTHASDKNKSNDGFLFVDHIVRSDHPQAIYDKNNDSKRLSVVVPLEPPQAGVDWTTVIFTFMCKNSCALGMNRRSTALIFTLERSNGEVIGRKMLKVRICSCPRRDMLKEEKDAFAAMLKKEKEGKTVEVAEIADENKTDQKRTVSMAKKHLKRLSHDIVDFQIRLPKMYTTRVAKIVRQTVLMAGEHRELTPEEKFTLNDCNKYIQ